MSVNNAVLIGNLGADPKVKVFDDGNKVVTLSLATDASWTNKTTGVRTEATDWHIVLLRRGVADVAERYLKKGHKIYVKGKMRTRKYVNDKNETHSVTEVHAISLLMLDSRPARNEPYVEKETPMNNNIEDDDVNSDEPVRMLADDEIEIGDSNKESNGYGSMTNNGLRSAPADMERGQGYAAMDMASDDINGLADEFNREAQQAQEQDDSLAINDDLPDWLMP